MNYIDDIAGCDTAQKAQEAYQALADTVTHWGMREALDKVVPPCTKCEVLGLWYDTEEMTISITEEKLVQAMNQLSEFMTKSEVMLTELQSLIGHLNFLTRCI